jgi:Domain of unknown function (DUF4190)/GYF domain 2
MRTPSRPPEGGTPNRASSGLTGAGKSGQSQGMYRILGADGREYGPIQAEQLRRWVAEGRANAETRTLAEGSTEWKPLAQFAEFSFLFAAAAPPIFGSTTPPLFVSLRKTNSFAVTGLVLGILSITGGLCCFGHLFIILALVFSIIGLVQIKNNPEMYEGKGIAIAGLVLAILGLIFWIGVIFFLSLGSILGESGRHAYRL